MHSKLNNSTRNRMTTLMFLLVLFGVGFLFIQCGKKEDPNSCTPSSAFSTIYSGTLSQSCVTCHNPSGTAYTLNNVLLDFSSQSTAYSTLTTKKATGLSTANHCSTVNIVSAGSPSTSYIEAVLDSAYNKSNFVVSGCTPYTTHLQDTNLSSCEKSNLTSWIQAGAPNN